MSLTIWAPVWLLWAVGVVAGLAVVGLVVLGVWFLVLIYDFPGDFL